MPKHLIIVIILLASAFSFKANTTMQNTVASNSTTTPAVEKHYNIDSLKRVLKGNLDFFAKHLLKGHAAVIQNYVRKYKRDTCGILTYKNSRLADGFEGVKTIKSIYVNKKADTIFVMPFNYCDEENPIVFIARHYHDYIPNPIATIRQFICTPGYRRRRHKRDWNLLLILFKPLQSIKHL